MVLLTKITLVNVYVDLVVFGSIQYVQHLGIDSSTDHPDRYSNLFLNAYINGHVHAEYLKMISFYSPLGIWHVFLYSINTQYLPLPVYEVPAKRVNTTKSTYTFTSVKTLYTVMALECCDVGKFKAAPFLKRNPG